MIISACLFVATYILSRPVTENKPEFTKTTETDSPQTSTPQTSAVTLSRPDPSTLDGALALQSLDEYDSNPNGEGEKYWQWADFDEEVSWCAISISYCADRCGLPEHSGMTPSIYADADDFHIPYHSANRYTPHVGDIIIYDFKNQRQYSDAPDAAQSGEHVGIVVSVDTHAKMVTVIEGNGTLKETELCATPMAAPLSTENWLRARFRRIGRLSRVTDALRKAHTEY